MSATMIQDKKNKDFFYVYIKNALCYYANVHKPKKIYQKSPTAANPSENEYSITLFVDDKIRAQLEDDFVLNKQLAKVGVDKNKKRQIKYKLSSQVEEGKSHYDLAEGLNGIQVTLPELKRNGQPNALPVLGADGKPFEENIGNGSIVTVKLFGYKNQEGLLNVSLNAVVVIDHVPYEGGEGGGDGMIHDEELGITYEYKRPEKKEEAVPEEPPFDIDDF